MKNTIKKKPARYVFVCEIHGAGEPRKIVYDAIDLITRDQQRRSTEEDGHEKSGAEKAP